MGELRQEKAYTASTTLKTMNFKKIHNVVTAIVMLSMPMIYFFGVWSWQTNEMSPDQARVEFGKHIYFVSFSSAFYCSSFVWLLLIRSNKLLKAIAASVNSFCAVVLYQEIVYRNEQWTQWSYWLIIIVAANYLLLYCIIERYKKLIHYE